MLYFCVVMVTATFIGHMIDASAHSKTYGLLDIKFADLVSLNPESAHLMVGELIKIGAIQISGIPRFGSLRKRALEDLADCFESENTAPMVVMNDGSRRVSAAAQSGMHDLTKLSHVCGEASTKLRAAVDTAASQIFLALDSVATSRGIDTTQNTLMQPSYNTFKGLMSNGRHLEHLHAYYSPENVSVAHARVAAVDSTINTLDYHRDAGLMIAMTTGYYSHADNNAHNGGLYLELPDYSRVKVEVDDDSLIILMGEGAASWLAPVFGAPLRAPLHSLRASLPAVGRHATRSWYGKMFLPPLDALITLKNSDQGLKSVTDNLISFGEYSRIQSASSPPLTGPLLPSACGSDLLLASSSLSTTSYRPPEAARTYAIRMEENCPKGEIWCWARCMETSDLWCKDDAVCYDTASEQITDGNSMCMDGSTITCGPSCIGQSNVSDFNGFCYGAGTSMFMQGFVSIVAEGESNTECVNLLFPEWTLDSKGKYAAACIFVFVMGIFIQFLSKLRTGVVAKMKDENLRKLCIVGIYGLHVTFGYFAMLVAMTYSVELFCMILSGLTVGFAIFHVDNPDGARSTDPCCPDTIHDSDEGSNLKNDGSTLYSPILGEKLKLRDDSSYNSGGSSSFVGQGKPAVKTGNNVLPATAIPVDRKNEDELFSSCCSGGNPHA